MQEVLISLLTFLAVVLIGAALISARAEHKKRLQERLNAAVGPHEETLARPGESGLVRLLDSIGKAVSLNEPSRNLRESLAKAGYHGSNAASMYLGFKIALALLGLVVSILLVFPLTVSFSLKLIACSGGTVLMFLVPNAYVEERRRKRSLRMRRHLPDAVDLLEICVASGMGLDGAWSMVSEEIRRVCPDLADEMALAHFEIELGSSRADAMRHMADRTGIEDLGSLVAVLVESERLGTSIADALRTFATSMRETRRFRAEEASEKATVKLLIPMILFIFPAIFIVLVGPAGIRLVQVIGK